MVSNDITKLIEAFVASFSAPPVIWVAYSGGVDSHVLLHALAPYKPNVVHVHHGLSSRAGAWQQHCQQVSEAFELAFYTTRLAITCAPQESWEAKARAARYAYMASLMREGDVLVTAHHQEDQAETVLLQLLRGASPKGLSAMPMSAAFAQGLLARPLLTVSKQSIRAYAQEKHLDWIEDDSNQDPKYARNYLRHAVLPLLTARWPSMAATLSRSARLCAESSVLLDEYAALLLARCDQGGYLSILSLKTLSRPQQKIVLRYYLQQYAMPLPSEVKLETLIDNVLYAKPDRHPQVCWPGVVVKRKKDVLMFFRGSIAS